MRKLFVITVFYEGLAYSSRGGPGTVYSAPLNASLLGLSSPGLPTAPSVASSLILSDTSSGVFSPSSALRYSASPATCGHAMLVPEMVFVAVLLPVHVLRMSTPGANTSSAMPQLLKAGFWLSLSTAPTVTALRAEAGEKSEASR